MGILSCARFGLWDDILSEPLYGEPDLYPAGCTAAHYARGIAFASLGRVSEAENEQVGQATFKTAGGERVRIPMRRADFLRELVPSCSGRAIIGWPANHADTQKR